MHCIWFTNEIVRLIYSMKLLVWIKHFGESVPPMLSIPNQLEAAYQGQDVTLECQTEAYPASINYWTTEKGDMIISGKNFILF